MSPAPDAQGATVVHRVRCHLDALLVERGLSLVELSERAGISVVDLSVLKDDRARAVRFTTLAAVCETLGCQPGDVLTVEPAEPVEGAADGGRWRARGPATGRSRGPS